MNSHLHSFNLIPRLRDLLIQNRRAFPTKNRMDPFWMPDLMQKKVLSHHSSLPASLAKTLRIGSQMTTMSSNASKCVHCSFFSSGSPETSWPWSQNCTSLTEDFARS